MHMNEALGQGQALSLHISNYKRVAIAFSGGVDSSLLIKSAIDALGRQNVLVLTADTIFLSAQEKESIETTVKSLGVKHLFVFLDVLSNRDVIRNTQQRCYYCKRFIFSSLRQVSSILGFNCLVDGTNLDDLKVSRPGRKALSELRIQQPFVELGIGKDEIRKLAKKLGLCTWNKPSESCMATRIATNEEISVTLLRKIELAENWFRTNGFKVFRFRVKGNCAEIAVAKDEMRRMFRLGLRPQIKTLVSGLGFCCLCFTFYSK